MAKRFVDTSKYRQAWRKLDPKFRAAYAWLVENADAAGFWVVDLEFFKFECGYALELDKFIKAVGGAVVRHGSDKINLVDFIQVNYGELKEGYNPHKPALRALSASTLTDQEPSLVQACVKLEEEGEEESKTVRKKEREEKVPAGELPYSSPEFAKAWNAFDQMRTAKRKPMTDRAKELIVADLTKMGETAAIESLNNSTRSGWTDVYPPKRLTTPEHSAERKTLKTTWD